MIFPESPRVVYGTNPLDQVICQLRFPPLLRIASEAPTEFQEKIRSEYPLLVEKQEARLQLPVGAEKVFPAEFLRQSDVAYEFSTDDELWTVHLTTGFLALTCRQYERWEQFGERLRPAFNALMEVYSPSFFTRIGLRYQNLIQKSRLNFSSDVSWAELLEPHVAGELAKPEIAAKIIDVAREFHVQQDASTKAHIRHGLVHIKQSDEHAYLIDSDFFTDERTKHGEVTNRLDEFNREARRLFRWCIKPKLHEALGPRDVDGSE